MAIEKVKTYFKEFNIDNRIMEFESSSATVSDAAKALNCDECHIAKSLTFKVLDNPIMIITSGDARIDNHKYKTYFNCKAKMLDSSEVELLIGHQVGGVCPFAINKNVIVYLDNSLKKYDYVFPACGSSNSAIKLTIEELEKYSNYKEWIDVTK